VQGVGYRYYARSRAQELGVRGYVKNLPDGRVEVVCVGPGPVIERFIADLEAGPSHGNVDSCQVTELAHTLEYTSFCISY
jgi:acylphosphatase